VQGQEDQEICGVTMKQCKAKTAATWHSKSHRCRFAAVEGGYCNRHLPRLRFQRLEAALKKAKERVVELQQEKAALLKETKHK
jgi:hypothetical protein